jgi:hypothetical protein
MYLIFNYECLFSVNRAARIDERINGKIIYRSAQLYMNSKIRQEPAYRKIKTLKIDHETDVALMTWWFPKLDKDLPFLVT